MDAITEKPTRSTGVEGTAAIAAPDKAAGGAGAVGGRIAAAPGKNTL